MPIVFPHTRHESRARCLCVLGQFAQGKKRPTPPLHAYMLRSWKWSAEPLGNRTLDRPVDEPLLSIASELRRSMS